MPFGYLHHNTGLVEVSLGKEKYKNGLRKLIRSENPSKDHMMKEEVLHISIINKIQLAISSICTRKIKCSNIIGLNFYLFKNVRN